MQAMFCFILSNMRISSMSSHPMSLQTISVPLQSLMNVSSVDPQ